MSKTLSFAAIALLAACLMLSAPSAGQAQYYRGYGYRGYAYPVYRGYAYPVYGGYGYRGYGYGGYYRPAVVHPEVLHWTPYRGLHTHGHIHVPHRGHYHISRY